MCTHTHTLARFAQTETRHKQKVEWKWILFPGHRGWNQLNLLCSHGALLQERDSNSALRTKKKKKAASQSILLTRGAVTSQALGSDWIRRVKQLLWLDRARTLKMSTDQVPCFCLQLLLFFLNIKTYRNAVMNINERKKKNMPVVGPLSSSPWKVNPNFTGFVGSVFVCLSNSLSAQSFYTILLCCVLLAVSLKEEPLVQVLGVNRSRVPSRCGVFPFRHRPLLPTRRWSSSRRLSAYCT